ASPRAKPARSISQAAESFTRPSRSGHRGIAGSPASASACAISSALTIGFTKNEPQLRRGAARDEPIRDGEDDVALRRPALEDAVPVAEATGVGAERDHPAGGAVE